MPIEVTCDSCSISYRVKDERAGTTIKCKECGSRIKVPNEDSEEDDLPQTPRPGAGKGQRKSLKRKKSAESNPQMLIIAGGGIAALAIVGLLIFLFTRGGKAPGDGNGIAAGPATTTNSGATGTQGTATQSGTTSVGGGWQVQIDPAPIAFAWPEEVNLDLPNPDQRGELIFPTSASPFVSMGYASGESAGAQMWNLATGKQVGAIRGKPAGAYMRSVSPDGKYLAIKVSSGQEICKFEIWSFESGELIRTILDEELPSIGFMDFGPDNLLCCRATGPRPQGARLKLWDVLQGTLVRTIPIDNFTDNCFAFSPGRRYLATSSKSDEITVFDLTAGNIAGTAATPSKSENTIHLGLDALRFTPDGSQIAAMSGGLEETRIFTIDTKTGQRNAELDLVFPASLEQAIDGGTSYKGPKLECLPNGGFLIAGGVWVDGATRRIVWYLDYGQDEYNFQQRVFVPNGLIALEGPTETRHLTVLDTNWKAINASVKALATDQKALVKPGQPVSLKFNIGALKQGTVEGATKVLADALTERLASMGIQVQEGQRTKLLVTYQEAAGTTLQQAPPNNLIGNAPGGATVQMTKALMNLTWVQDAEKPEDKERKLWSKSYRVNPQFLIVEGNATSEKAHAAMIKDLKQMLVTQPIPYFVPSTEDLVTLPARTTLKDPNPAATARRKAAESGTKKPQSSSKSKPAVKANGK
ncbi:MAG: hypothetical protein JWM11_3930 [Planctomycetaceae bacterium]|nr:hypothetical protein [Planctomycetaceae bacterium]